MMDRAFWLLVVLAAGILLYQNLGTAAPIRQMSSGTLAQLSIERRLATADGLFRSASDGANLSVRFTGFDPTDPDQGLLLSELYYRSVYTLYPARVFAGRDDQLIRYPGELLAAQQTAEAGWLESHGVRNRLNITRDSSGQIYSQCRPLR